MLPEDGSIGPKHVGVNKDILTVRFNILCVINGAFVGEKNLDVIKMHGTTIKNIHSFFS